ncbi:MAG: hypothetical protein PHN69_03700 [Candidatus Pacebacteria bacterium]|nr:hypothetical protein [Candidatus Paceibacterota bacterium]
MQITFPKNEWGDIQRRLNENKVVYTVRVDNEYGKYKIGDILETEFGNSVQILSVKKITAGLEELQKEYQYFDQLTEEMIKEILPFKNIEIISLRNYIQ